MTGKKDKIFCKDCRYIWVGYQSYPRWCNHPKCFVDNCFAPKERRVKDYYDLNKDNSCKFFKSKRGVATEKVWWKFWNWAT